MAHQIAPEAERDLDDIWLYIAKGSGNIEAADRFVDLLTARFWLLSQFPHMGRSPDRDLGLDLRAFPVGDYIILYRVVSAVVLVVRVVRGSRSVEDLLRN